MELVARSAGATLRCRLEGPDEAPAVLLMHALGTTLELWDAQAAELASRFRVIRFDTRGHGRSSAPGGEYTLTQLGEDALAVLDAAGATSAHVVGISLGGLTAMWLGAHAAPRVRALVLANTAARIGSVERWTERIALVHDRGMGAVADLAVPTWFTEAFVRDRPGDAARCMAMVAACAPDGYVGCCAALRDADLRDAIGGIQAPTLVLAGTHDRSTPMAEAEAIRAAVRGAGLFAFEAAHLTNVECADEFTRRTAEFLSSTGDRHV